MKGSSAINTIMPTLQVDQTGLICVAVVNLLVLLGMLWAIYLQSCRLAAMRGKLGGLESQQTTEKTPATTCPALDEKLESASTTVASQEDGIQEVSFIMQDKDAQEVPWSETHNTKITLDPTSPDDWDLAFIVPSSTQSSSPSVYFRETAVPKGGLIMLYLARFDDDEGDGHTLIRMRLSPPKEKKDLGTVAKADLGFPVQVKSENSVLGKDSWVKAGNSVIAKDTWVYLQKSAQ